MINGDWHGEPNYTATFAHSVTGNPLQTDHRLLLQAFSYGLRHHQLASAGSLNYRGTIEEKAYYCITTNVKEWQIIKFSIGNKHPVLHISETLRWNDSLTFEKLARVFKCQVQGHRTATPESPDLLRFLPPPVVATFRTKSPGAESLNNLKLSNVIGEGRSSWVWGPKTRLDLVVKVEKDEEWGCIAKENKFLNRLADANVTVGIPTVCAIGRVFKRQAIALAPRGIPLSTAFKSEPVSVEFLTNLVKSLLIVLEHVHKTDICHKTRKYYRRAHRP